MSRITGTDAFNMMEAYNAVYASQEITEEQVQEDFENWVNSLVEEGYDLSEYTWEDMYEEYISEIPINPAGNRPISNAPYRSRFARPMNAGTPQQTGRGTAVSRPQIGSLPSSARQVTQYPQGVSTGVGGGNASASRPTRPAPAPARPVASAPTRPAAATSSARPATATSSARPAAAPQAQSQRPTTSPVISPIERRTPTSAELRQAQQLRTTGSNLTGTGALATRPATPAPATATTPAPAAAPKPSLQQQIRQRRLNMDLDLFDIVQGYLIDEGYAETEEAAAVIMANMSEEWKESILESGYFPTKESQMKDEAKHNLRGQAVKPRTAQTQSPKPSR